VCVCKRSDEKYLAVRKIKWLIYVIGAGNMMLISRRLVGIVTPKCLPGGACCGWCSSGLVLQLVLTVLNLPVLLGCLSD
jgi:hypothetical protein